MRARIARCFFVCAVCLLSVGRCLFPGRSRRCLRRTHLYGNPGFRNAFLMRLVGVGDCAHRCSSADSRNCGAWGTFYAAAHCALTSGSTVLRLRSAASFDCVAERADNTPGHSTDARRTCQQKLTRHLRSTADRRICCLLLSLADAGEASCESGFDQPSSLGARPRSFGACLGGWREGYFRCSALRWPARPSRATAQKARRRQSSLHGE